MFINAAPEKTTEKPRKTTEKQLKKPLKTPKTPNLDVSDEISQKKR